MDSMTPSGWWRVTAPDGSIWCEASDEQEARQSMRPGDVLKRQYVKTITEWRVEM